MIPLPLPEQHPLNVQYDWKAYFYAFQEEHGQGLEYKGRLLFQDGWMYSRSDYSGPEYRPPDEPEKLKRLKRAYWLIRWNNARTELELVNTTYLAMRAQERTRSVALRVSSVMRDETGRLKRTYGEHVDWGTFEERIEYCVQELAACEAQLIMLDPTRSGRSHPDPDDGTKETIRAVMLKASGGLRGA
jgi:hypothetical protein